MHYKRFPPTASIGTKCLCDGKQTESHLKHKEKIYFKKIRGYRLWIYKGVTQRMMTAAPQK